MYAFDHRDTTLTGVGALGFLEFKFIGLRVGGSTVTVIPLTNWDELVRMESEALNAMARKE